MDCTSLELMDNYFISIFKGKSRSQLDQLIPANAAILCFLFEAQSLNIEGLLDSPLYLSISKFCKFCRRALDIYHGKVFYYLTKAGSGAIIARTDKYATKIIDIDPIDISDSICPSRQLIILGNKIMFVKELWAHSYIQRMIPKKVSRNFVSYYDKYSYMCSNILNINNLPKNMEMNGRLYGYLTMKLLDGSLYDYVKSGYKLNYGHIFEILYAKYIAKKYCNLVFTDHNHMGNYGYMRTNKIRKYTFGDMTIYVSNREYIKLIDLADSVITPEDDRNFFWTINDVFPGNDITMNDNFRNISKNDQDSVQTLFLGLRKTFISNTQMEEFSKLIELSVPDLYRNISNISYVKIIEFSG